MWLLKRQILLRICLNMILYIQTSFLVIGMETIAMVVIFEFSTIKITY